MADGEPLAKALRRLRLLSGMKQSHLAELLGVTQATVSRWERGELNLSAAQRAAAQLLLAAPPHPAQDVALKRLVETSTTKVHLICDRTHRLLAASPSPQADWRADATDYIGRSLIIYASPEILEAEAKLPDLGWRDGLISSLALETGPNIDPVIRILPSRMLWERVALSDGSAGRLVTTLP